MDDLDCQTEWILREELPEATSAERERVRRRMMDLIAQAVRMESDRCVEHCRQRAALWDRTALRTSSLPPAVAEARYRGNEAKYLADLLETATPAAGNQESDS